MQAGPCKNLLLWSRTHGSGSQGLSPTLLGLVLEVAVQGTEEDAQRLQLSSALG